MSFGKAVRMGVHAVKKIDHTMLVARNVWAIASKMAPDSTFVKQTGKHLTNYETVRDKVRSSLDPN